MWGVRVCCRSIWLLPDTSSFSLTLTSLYSRGRPSMKEETCAEGTSPKDLRKNVTGRKSPIRTAVSGAIMDRDSEGGNCSRVDTVPLHKKLNEY